MGYKIWAVSLNPNNVYQQTPVEDTRICQVALSANINGSAKNAKDRCSLKLTIGEKLTFTVASFYFGQTEQCSTDIILPAGELVSFEAVGPHVIDIIGYQIDDADDEDDFDEDMYMEGDDEEDDEEDDLATYKSKRKAARIANLIDAEADEDDDDEDDEDFDGEDDEDDEDEDEDDEDEDDEDEDDEDEDDEDEDEDDEEDKKKMAEILIKRVKKEQEKQKQEVGKKAPAPVAAPAPAAKKAKIEEPAETKSNNNNNNNNNKNGNKPAVIAASTPVKKEKEQQTTPAKTEQAKPAAKTPPSSTKPATPEVEIGKFVKMGDGLEIKDINVGSSTTKAKNGRSVTVKYTGKLLNGNKFDSGSITFRLGTGEVIKGWDRGIAGMSVGSKRVLKVPPHLAYGDKGAPPSIPKNATLMFDVELIKCS